MLETMTSEQISKELSDAFECGRRTGLTEAATWLRAKADKMRKPEDEFGAPTANMMARVYDTEADGILSLRK